MRKTFFCIDSHACGNPVRVVAGGGPLLPHLPIAERRALFVRDHDWIRTALMFEPRGHDVMSGAIFYPPYRDDCDGAVVFIDRNTGVGIPGSGRNTGVRNTGVRSPILHFLAISGIPGSWNTGVRSPILHF